MRENINDNLKPLDRQLLEYIDKCGFTSRTCCRLYLRKSIITIERALDRLVVEGLIYRPQQGLIVSHSFISVDKSYRVWCSNQIKTPITKNFQYNR